eukprot:7841436-Alexandrium_andersonii.AAC.1
MRGRGGVGVRNIDVLTSANGRQVLHTLWRTRDRSPGLAELDANLGLNSAQWVRGDYEGAE